MGKTLMDVLGSEFDAGCRAGREDAAWAVLAALHRAGVQVDPAEILRAARGIPDGPCRLG